jgi:hypothetical protein
VKFLSEATNKKTNPRNQITRSKSQEPNNKNQMPDTNLYFIGACDLSFGAFKKKTYNEKNQIYVGVAGGGYVAGILQKGDDGI